MGKRSKKLLVSSLAIVCTLGVTHFVSAADYFSGGPRTGASNLKYVVSNMPSDTYKSNIVGTGAARWNNISSKVYISRNSTGATISAKVSYQGGYGVWGETIKYYKNSWGGLSRASTSELWDACDVFGYENMMNHEDFSFNDDEKRYVWTHEFGHVMSLSENNDESVPTVMEQVQQDIGVQDIDKTNLKAKWGN